MEKELLLKELEAFEYFTKCPTIKKFLMKKFKFTGYNISNDRNIFFKIKLAGHCKNCEFDQCIEFILEFVDNGQLTIIGLNNFKGKIIEINRKERFNNNSTNKQLLILNNTYTTQGLYPNLILLPSD